MIARAIVGRCRAGRGHGLLIFDSNWLGGLYRILSSQRCCDNGVQIVHVEGVFAQQLGASCRMSLLVSRAKVLTHKGPATVGEVAMVDLFGVVIQLVTVQVLRSRVALPAALVRAFKLLVEPLPAPPPLPRGAVLMAITPFAVVAVVVVPVAPAPARVAAVGRGRRVRLIGTRSGVHFVSQLRLDGAQVGRVGWLHGEDLRRHGRVVGRVERDVVCRDLCDGGRIPGCSAEVV